ncbi:hypothetical protein GQ600_24739 [Phytophthora cactorum]|nr:hypothetical protein GQ600_24739 [Phytophthora cactorum]
MANRKITRCRGARGQLALYNPHTVPIEGAIGLWGCLYVGSDRWCAVAQELEGIYGFRPKGRKMI